MKRLAIKCKCLLILSVYIVLLTACGGENQSPEFDIDSINDYRHIPNVTQEEIDAIEKLKVENASFSYGHFLETEAFKAADGSFAGFTIELCGLLSELFGIPFTPYYCDDWEILITGLDNQTIDFTGCLTPTKEREERYIMSSHIAGRNLSVYTRADSPETTDMSGMRIGFLSGTVTKEMIMEPYSKLSVESVDVGGLWEAVELLRVGEIDGFIIDSTVDPQFENYKFIRSKELFWPTFTQVSIATGNKDFAPIISVINKYLEIGGDLKLREMYDQGNADYDKYKLQKSLTNEEKEYIYNHGANGEAIKISLEHDNYPFSFYNKANARFEGIAVEVLEEISTLLDIRFENTSNETTPWPNMIEDLKTGRVSLVSHLVYSDERAKDFIWSTIPYSLDNYVLISKASFPPVKSYEIPSLRTGAFKGSIYEYIYNQWFPDSHNLFLFDTESEAFDALEKGDIDMVLGADFMLLAQTYYREKSGYVINFRFDASLDSAFGFNKNETVLRSVIDKAMPHVNIDPISNYWTGRVFDYAGQMERQRMGYILSFTVFLLCALIGMSILFIKNKRLTTSLSSRTVTLSNARQSMQTILDTVPLPIGIMDRDTQFMVYGNDDFLELMEIESHQELCALKGVDTFAPVQEGGLTASELSRLLIETEEQFVKELRLITAKSKVIDVRMHTSWSDYNGKPSAIAIVVDLTAEKEYRQILMAAAEHEKEANQAKSLFLANMSHEIRTPMNGIIGMTDLLLAEEISGRQLQYVKDIKTSAESLLGIINDILDLSKVTAGKLKITPVDMDLYHLLKNIVSMVGFSARVKGLRFVDDIRINSPEYVRLDDIRVKQVIINLLSNAVKFTKEGYVKLMVKIEDDNIIMEISDTGIGIKPENLSQIYGEFEQVDTYKNRDIKGTGLGLSITKNLVELMGGNLDAESEYGAGTTFRVTLPYEQGDKSKIQNLQEEFTYLFAPTAKVLLVDDIQTNLTVGSGLLRLCGITADTANSGKEAIELVKRKDYDIVFMDHMMPELDGVDTTAKIREMGGKYQSLTIIALTANAMNEAKELLLQSGMDDFLSKPIDKTALMAILKKWLPPDKLEEGGNTGNSARPVEYSGALDAAARINGLNIQQALGRIGGLQDVLETSLKQIAQSIDDKLRKMDTSLCNNELQSFALEAHGLKGSLANVGANYSSELAAQLELSAKAGDMNLCMEKFPQFASVLEGLSLGLKPIFEKTEDEEKPQGDMQLLEVKVNEAIALLEQFEATDAIACLKELDNYSFGQASKALLDIIAKIEAFKYDESIKDLKNIKELDQLSDK